MDLRVVGGPDSHRVRLDVLACPMPGPAERARVDIAGAALSAIGLAATVYALIESQARLGRPRRRRVAGHRGRGTTGVRGMGTPRPAPLAAARPVHRSATSRAPIWPPHSSTAPSRWPRLRSPSTPKRSRVIAATVAGLVTLPTPSDVVSVRQTHRRPGRPDRTPGFPDDGPGAGRARAAAHPPRPRIQHRHTSAARDDRPGHRYGRSPSHR